MLFAVAWMCIVLLYSPVVAPPGLIEITNEQFFDTLTNPNKVERLCLVMWHAPWSAASRAFVPGYGVLSNKVREEKLADHLTIAKMDIGKFVQLARSQRIESWPTLLLYGPHFVHPKAYRGDLEPDALVEWLKVEVEAMLGAKREPNNVDLNDEH